MIGKHRVAAKRAEGTSLRPDVLHTIDYSVLQGLASNVHFVYDWNIVSQPYVPKARPYARAFRMQSIASVLQGLASNVHFV